MLYSKSRFLGNDPCNRLQTTYHRLKPHSHRSPHMESQPKASRYCRRHNTFSSCCCWNRFSSRRRTAESYRIRRFPPGASFRSRDRIPPAHRNESDAPDSLQAPAACVLSAISQLQYPPVRIQTGSPSKDCSTDRFPAVPFCRLLRCPSQQPHRSASDATEFRNMRCDC